VSYYVVVEGACSEVKVYPKWISLLNPSLTQVHSLEDVEDGCYYLVSGFGYPNYFSVIDNALKDMEVYPRIGWLVIAVDAESMSYGEKKREILDYVSTSKIATKTKIIIQNACLETWALGNKLIIKRHPGDLKLREYLRIHDVTQKDPEELPHLPREKLNRAQFAGAFLRRALRDKYPKLIYSKRDPQVIVHEKYFQQLVKRNREDNHIRSFSDFLGAFSA
jgi:hypothetical protein